MSERELGDMTKDEQERISQGYIGNSQRLLANPDDPKELSDKYTFLSIGPRSNAQLMIAKRCYEVAPNEFIAVFNYASALSRAGYNSVEMYKKALAIAPPDRKAIALHHIGLAYHDAKEYDSAMDYYLQSRAINLAQPVPAIDPILDRAISLLKLARGDLRQGLHEFEVVHIEKAYGKDITKAGIPWWNGEDLTGKSVIVTHDQGFGDTLQFIRFAPLLKERCRTLIFSGPESLAPLIAEQFDCFDDVVNEVGPFEADYIATPMVMTALLGIEYKDVTGWPYMSVKPLDLPPRGKLKVGISWRGSPRYRNDALRSSNLEAFTPLFDLPGAAFYSFQKYPAPTEISDLGLDGFIADVGSHLGDWRDTARALAAMDVYVSTDSAGVHMAGALGIPTLLLLGKNECWRWQVRGPDRDSAWYNSVKIFRQKKVDAWPMLEVRRELESMVNRARHASSRTLLRA